MEKASENSEKFLWIGNEASIDFINTDMAVSSKAMDLLETSEDYLAWVRLAGMELRIAPNRRGAKRGFELARDFRSVLRNAFEQIAKAGTVPAPALTAVNAYLSRSGMAGELRRERSGFALREYWKIDEAADYVTPVAWSFARFLARADLNRVRKCRNPDCVLFFYDTSKSGTRSWCSLDICGNKMRMAAFRKRQ